MYVVLHTTTWFEPFIAIDIGSGRKLVRMQIAIVSSHGMTYLNEMPYWAT